MSDKSKITQLLEEHIAKEYDREKSSKSIQSFFEYYVASHLLNEYSLNNQQIQKGITGSGGDGGIDSAFCLVNDINLLDHVWTEISIPNNSRINLILIQTKYKKTYQEDVILKWRQITGDLLDMNADIERYRERYNEKILSFFQNFHTLYKRSLSSFPRLRINFYYTTLSDLDPHPKVVSLAQELETELKSRFPNLEEGKVSFIGSATLYEQMRKKEKKVLSIKIQNIPFYYSKECLLIQAYSQDILKIPVIIHEKPKDTYPQIVEECKGMIIETEKIDYAAGKQILLTNPRIISPSPLKKFEKDEPYTCVQIQLINAS